MAKTDTIIPEKIFFKIGEVCDLVGVQAHVLRYWETEFPMLSPKKNKSGQRTYRRKDVEIALRIKDLLYEELFTIAGAKKRLQSEIRGGGKSKKKAAQASKEIQPGEQPSLIEDSAAESAGAAGSFELDDKKRDALKSLVSQLLEVREMLKTTQTSEAEQHLSTSKEI